MFRKLLFICLAFVFPVLNAAAQEEDRHFRSEDGAVEFSYPAEWTIESQNHVFDTVYQYRILTPPYNPFQDPAERSQIFIELINPENNDYARDFETAADFAEYAIEQSFGADVDLEETEIASYSAVRSAPIPTGREMERQAILYGIMRDDGWVIVASINAPNNPAPNNDNDIENGEEDLLSILDSLVFDAEAATIPFERNLEVYDTSGIELEETYVSEDGVLSVNYPADWQLEEPDSTATMISTISYWLPFRIGDEGLEADIMIFKIGDEYFNSPRDLDTPEEYLQAHRNTDEDITEFRIGDYDAFSLFIETEEGQREDITFALNDEWIVLATITAETEETLQQYEPSLVAVLESIDFVVNTAFINSPILQVDLPEPWEVGDAVISIESNYFELRSNDATRFQNADIFIYLNSIEAMGVEEAAAEGLESLLTQVTNIEFETDTLTIADYEVLRSDITAIEGRRGQFYAAISLAVIDEDWLLFIVAQSTEAEDLPLMLDDIDTLIEEMVFTLPGDK